jgi:CRP-like cAMP-binding protein
VDHFDFAFARSFDGPTNCEPGQKKRHIHRTGIHCRGVTYVDRPSEFHERLGHQLREWGLPVSFVDDITNHLTLVTYEKGTAIFLRGSPADFLFCLLNGFAKLYLPHGDGNRTLIALARPGDLLGVVDSLDSHNHRGQVFEAHALTKCSVGLVSRDHLVKALYTLDSKTIILLLERINTVWSAMFEWYAMFMGLPFRERLQIVFDNLTLRVGVSDRRGVLLLPVLTHEDLAEMIGSSRPMVSRLINDMAQEGLLIRGEKQRYVIRSTHRSAGTMIPKLNEHETSHMLFASDKRGLAAHDGAKASYGLSCVSPLTTMQTFRRQDYLRARI